MLSKMFSFQIMCVTDWGPAAIGCSHVAGPVEVSEGVMSRGAVARGELVGEGLAAHSVDGAGEVVVGDGGVAGLDGPHGLANQGQ